MSSIQGKVGKHEFIWKKAPQGPKGSAIVVAKDGKEIVVSWRRDADGLWIETPSGTYGFDVRGAKDDDGRMTFSMRARNGEGAWSGLHFSRAGEEAAAAAAGGVKKNVRVRAQMPGKIIRISVKPGDEVAKDQPILVMEAMKMENEIRAPQAGKVGQVKVTEGQAVETGADLCLIDPI